MISSTRTGSQEWPLCYFYLRPEGQRSQNKEDKEAQQASCCKPCWQLHFGAVIPWWSVAGPIHNRFVDEGALSYPCHIFSSDGLTWQWAAHSPLAFLSACIISSLWGLVVLPCFDIMFYFKIMLYITSRMPGLVALRLTWFTSFLAQLYLVFKVSGSVYYIFIYGEPSIELRQTCSLRDRELFQKQEPAKKVQSNRLQSCNLLAGDKISWSKKH